MNVFGVLPDRVHAVGTNAPLQRIERRLLEGALCSFVHLAVHFLLAGHAVRAQFASDTIEYVPHVCYPRGAAKVEC